MKRREFIKASAMGAAIVPCLTAIGAGVFGAIKSAWAQATEIVKLEDPTATALGYVHDATKVDVAKWPKRAGAEGATQFCHNCQFAVGEAKTVEGKEGKWVDCQLFPGKLVAQQGWCNSWTLKTV